MQPLKKVRCHLCLHRAVTVSGLLSPYQQRGAWGQRAGSKFSPILSLTGGIVLGRAYLIFWHTCLVFLSERWIFSPGKGRLQRNKHKTTASQKRRVQWDAVAVPFAQSLEHEKSGHTQNRSDLFVRLTQPLDLDFSGSFGGINFLTQMMSIRLFLVSDLKNH